MELKFGITKKYKLNFMFWRLKWKIVLCKKKENALMHFLEYRKMIRRNIALIFMWKWKRKMEGWECKDKFCVSLCVGIGDGRKMRVGIFRGKKWKRKMERKMERMEWIENEMKINGDGYGKNKLVKEKIGIGVAFT